MICRGFRDLLGNDFKMAKITRFGQNHSQNMSKLVSYVSKSKYFECNSMFGSRIQSHNILKLKICYWVILKITFKHASSSCLEKRLNLLISLLLYSKSILCLS